MELTAALALSQQFVSKRTQHDLYVRVCRLREIYKALITGENAEALLKRFVRREDDEAFAQRVDLTIAITPAVCASLMKPFNKVLRNDKVKKHFDFKTDARNKIVQQMRTGFYGRKRSKNKGFDYWLKMRYPMLSFVDPNSWVVTEWNAPQSGAEIIQPRPYEVTSIDAWNWLVINEEPKWLWVHTDITYKKLNKGPKQRIAEARAANVFDEVPGDMFTLYDEEYTITYTQVDMEYVNSVYYQKSDNETFWQEPGTKAFYSVKVYTPNLGFVPAFRVGYIADTETNGQTFLNGWHDAMPYLMKSIKTVSEMDLTMALHAFPQKMQYVKKCPGTESTGAAKIKRRCDYGIDAEGKTCRACKGVGFQVHTTAQDALYFPFPESNTPNNEILDLEKVLVYKTPPIDLLTFQKNYIDALKVDCSAAVFTQTQQTKVTGTGGGASGAPAPVTATEIGNNMQGTYDALYPFTEKVSDVWTEEIYTMGRLAGVPDGEDEVITCIFPADLKMKSIEELLVELAAVNAAGGPSYLRDQINNDIAEIMYQGDEIAALMYAVRHKFYPFNGQTADEIAMLIASQYVSKETKILYSNFEAIFNDIDLENPGFWFMTYDEQAVIVEAMVAEYIDEIDTENSLALQIPGDAPNGGDTGAGAGGDNANDGEPEGAPTPTPTA